MTSAPSPSGRILTEHWNLTYRHNVGDTGSRFFDGIQHDAVLRGRRCPSCKRVLLPPRAFCDRCFVATTDWVDCANEGVLEVFTIVAQSFQGLPEAPYCFGYVRVDGADTAVVNYIRGLDLTDVRAAAASLTIGQRVRVVFAGERTGRMTDFWFEV